MKKLVMIGFLVLFFIGCAARDQIVKNIQNDSEMMPKQIDLLLEPVDTVGILETEFLKKGETSFYEVTFPEILFLGETFPGRIKWYCWFIENRGNEFLAQLLWTYRVRLNSKVVGVVSIEGEKNKTKEGKITCLSTRSSYAYSIDESEKEIPILREKFNDDPKYRQEIALKVGIEISTLKKADYMYSIINQWNRATGPRGIILTPLTKEKFDDVAVINPAYSNSQKAVENFSATFIPLDPIATGVTWFMEFANASGIPSQGWDFDHKEDHRIMAVKAKHLIDVKFQGIEKMMDEIKKKR